MFARAAADLVCEAGQMQQLVRLTCSQCRLHLRLQVHLAPAQRELTVDLQPYARRRQDIGLMRLMADHRPCGLQSLRVC